MNTLARTTATCQQLPLFGVLPVAPAPPNVPPACDQYLVTLDSHTSLSAAITAFADHLAARRDMTQGTRWAMLRDLTVVGRLLGLNRDLGSLVQADLKRVQEVLQDISKPSTVERRLSTLSQFIRWLKAKGCVNARLLVAVPKAAEALPTVLSPGQVDALLCYTAERGKHSAAGARLAFLVRLLLATAMKKQDALALRVNDLALDDHAPQVRVGRGNKARYIAVPADLRSAWRAYADACAPVELVFMCSYKMLERDLADASGAIQWTHVLGFNTLRWTAALRDLQSGIEPERLRRKMGLSEIQWEETLALLGQLAA